jgi:hypothetical protein
VKLRDHGHYGLHGPSRNNRGYGLHHYGFTLIYVELMLVRRFYAVKLVVGLAVAVAAATGRRQSCFNEGLAVTIFNDGH